MPECESVAVSVAVSAQTPHTAIPATSHAHDRERSTILARVRVRVFKIIIIVQFFGTTLIIISVQVYCSTESTTCSTSRSLERCMWEWT